LADGNYHGNSFGLLPDGTPVPGSSALAEIDPNDPRFAGLTRKQQLELQLKIRQERKQKEE
jgi:hypothetical protein